MNVSFQKDGFALLRRVIDPALCAQLLAEVPAADGPGSRTLLEQPWCAELAERLRRSSAMDGLLPEGHTAVQCTFFEKSKTVNWLVPLHQDLSIPVLERVNGDCLRGWSHKSDGWYVQPLLELLEQMVAVRVHLDECGAEDGPLHVVPGSHLRGIVPAAATSAMRSGEPACLAAAGDVLVMRPLLLHRSSKSIGVSKRRVLHFLFGPAQLPGGLRWRARKQPRH